MAIGPWVCPSCLAVFALSTFLIPSVSSSRIHLPGSRNSTPITGASSLVEPLVPGRVTSAPRAGLSPFSLRCLLLVLSPSIPCPASFAYALCSSTLVTDLVRPRLRQTSDGSPGTLGPKRVHLRYGPRIHFQMLPTRYCYLAVSFSFRDRAFTRKRTFTSLTTRPLGRTEVRAQRADWLSWNKPDDAIHDVNQNAHREWPF